MESGLTYMQQIFKETFMDINVKRKFFINANLI